MAQFNDDQFYQYPPFNPVRTRRVWDKVSEFTIPVVSSVGIGPKGDKGDKGDSGSVFDELNDYQLERLKDGLRGFYKKVEAVVTTVSPGTTVVQIPFDGYRPTDILLVSSNGLDLAEGTDYLVDSDNAEITLTTPVASGTKVRFTALRIAAIEAENYDAIKGSDGTFENLTDLQKAELKEDLMGFYKKSEAIYVVPSATNTVPIPNAGYRSTDILLVDVDGLDKADGIDYEIDQSALVFDSVLPAASVVHCVAFRVATVEASAYELLKGDDGLGVPAGGLQGQVLSKISDEDNATEWRTLSVEDMVGGVLPIEYGGTGATEAYDALQNLGVSYGSAAPANSGTPNTIYIQIL